MSQLRKILDRILNVLAGVSFLAMVALTCWQVFTRYILKNPSSWSEEMVSYLFGWMALLGASIVVGERGHMNIPILVDRMGEGGRKFFAIFAAVSYTHLDVYKRQERGCAAQGSLCIPCEVIRDCFV